ncbi:hypothetical protein R6L23_27390 [Streptomyces sp. SR27]|uniref:hypothetical protein n=1 Tax=Streptomyces sp. SR27 TaxID=3076630 RepID=UPI00295B2B61|nr:hypothetical protein [Streptomyces sp. SR27]MDV9191882.1 hypothetical protein [Streptomyces sp. SR27]
MDPVTARFIETATALPPATLATVFDEMVKRRSTGGREASREAKVSASENSSINRAVRSALLPRADELTESRNGLHSDAISACGIAARAVRKRGKLTEEQYVVLVEPFMRTDAAVPAWTPEGN